MLRNEEIVGMVTILAVTCHPDCFLSENLEIWARSIQPTESNGRHLKNIFIMKALLGFPGGSDGKESACSAGDPAVIPGLGRFPWRSRLPTPVFLPGKSHEQRILVGYSRWGHKELDTTEATQQQQQQHVKTWTIKNDSYKKNDSYISCLWVRVGWGWA